VTGYAAGERARSRIPTAVLYVVLVIAAIVTVLPFVWVISGSLRSIGDFRSDPGAWLPSVATLENYAKLFTSAGFGGFLVNSLVVAAITVAGNVIGGALAGYALAKLEFRGKRVAFVAVLIALMMPFSATFVAQFMITVDIGLVNTLAGIALPTAVLPISVFIVRQYAASIPDELLEAARLEGAGELDVLRRVVLPLSKAVIAVIGLFYAVSYWNAFFNALLYLNKSSMWPLQLIVRSYVVQNATLGDSFGGATPPPTDAIEMAILVLSIVPVLVVYPFIQRHFTKGVIIGAIKGCSARIGICPHLWPSGRRCGWWRRRPASRSRPCRGFSTRRGRSGRRPGSASWRSPRGWAMRRMRWPAASSPRRRGPWASSCRTCTASSSPR